MTTNDRTAGREARRPLAITRYPGGKWYLINWITDHLPKATRFVEGFAGTATILLNRLRAEEEILIEKNPDQATLLRVVRDQPQELIERLQPLRWDRLTFMDARFLLEAGAYDTDLERAALVYTVRKQSFGGIGGSFAYVIERNPQRQWDRGLRRLLRVSERLHGVEVINANALDVLKRFDAPDTLFYLDPPYVLSSRSPATLYGQYEMSDDDHRSLCVLIRRLEGKVVLSGYANPIYDELLGDWRTVKCDAYAYARPGGGPRVKKVEVLWKNF